MLVKVLSLLLCLGTITLWVTSYTWGVYAGWRSAWQRGDDYHVLGVATCTGMGGILLGADSRTDRNCSPDRMKRLQRSNPPGHRFRAEGQPPGMYVGRTVSRKSIWNRLGFNCEYGDDHKEYELLRRITHEHGPDANDVAGFQGYIAFPAWIPATAFAVLPGIAVMRRLHRTRARKEALCPSCGYDLRATPERCPECGKEVEPLGGMNG